MSPQDLKNEHAEVRLSCVTEKWPFQDHLPIKNYCITITLVVLGERLKAMSP